MRFLGPITALLSGLLGSTLVSSALVGSALVGAAWAEPLLSLANPAMLCRPAIAAAEQASAIPPQLLAAIGRVESGRRDPGSGVTAPWPWTINAEGQGSFFDTKAQVIAAVQVLQARGVQSIDGGCMQVNLMHHPHAFANLDQAFDPTANAAYAARFLNDLHTQTNDWPRASGMYHSATPEVAAPYAAKVASVWTEERHLAGGAPPMPAAWPAAPGAFPQIAGGGFHGGVPATMAHGTLPVGRDLAAYRAMPVQFAAHGPSIIRHY